MRPNTFYITFKYEDTLVKVCDQKLEFDFCGQKVQLKRAKEPTDIIWENRHVTKRRRCCNAFGVIVIIVVILLSFFTLATWALQLKLELKYYQKPPGVNCNSVIDNYGQEGKDWALRRMAYDEA
jgi:hypothetical protein